MSTLLVGLPASQPTTVVVEVVAALPRASADSLHKASGVVGLSFFRLSRETAVL